MFLLYSLDVCFWSLVLNSPPFLLGGSGGGALVTSSLSCVV